MASFARGNRLGPYETIDAIGAGGMGEVWKARDTRLERIVAIKTSKEQFSERFDREARAVAALNHPHICQLYDVGPNYLVMEFIEGAPLKGPLAIEKAVEYAGQILEALDAAHRKGITHRDLKPANILVTKQGIKLLDFGLAKQAGPLAASDDTLTQALTQRGEIVGTLQYMSPEQLQGKETDARSDLFAFGCVLYEMLTGKRAFEGESAASVIAGILERDPLPLTTAPPLERVVKRALAKDPDQRFQTARDLKAALTWAMEHAPAPTASDRSRRWLWVAAVVVSALAGWAVSQFRQPLAEDRAFRLQMLPPEGGQFPFGNGVGGIALSPDARTAALVAVAGGKTQLWIRPLDGAAARLIAGSEGAYAPFWSPEGKSIAFFTPTRLLRIDLGSGAPVPICSFVGARGDAWTEDGRILFGTLASGLFQVPASGGTPAPLTVLGPSSGESYHRWPQALSGDRFLYFVQNSKPGKTGIYVSTLAKPAESVQLLATETNAVYAPGSDGKGSLLWVRGGTLMAQEFDPTAGRLSGEFHPVVDPVAKMSSIGVMEASAARGGVLLYAATNIASQFTWLDRTGKPQGVVGDPGEFNSFALSRDGRRVLASRDMMSSTSLWLLEVERAVAGPFGVNTDLNIYPVWSPDGRTVIFSGGSPRNLFRKESDGARPEDRLIESANPNMATDWSRDGRWILYYEITSGGRRLYTLTVTPEGKVAPGASPKPYLQVPFNEYNGRFSPESAPRWVAYQSDASSRFEVYVQAFPEPRGRTQISVGGGHCPRWGLDGREIFYVSPENRLMTVGLKVNGDSIEPAAPRELFPLPAIDTGWCPFEVAPDGQRFLIRANPGQAGAPLTVIVNWPALLKTGAGTP